MRADVRSTYTPNVLAGIGAFGGLFDAASLKQMCQPVLVASTDGVGTTVQVISQHLAKLRLAGLVEARREGRRQVYLVNDPHLVAMVREMITHLDGRAGGGRGASSRGHAKKKQAA